MAIWIESYYFWFYQIPPLLIHLLVISALTICGYKMIHLFYITPVIFFMMFLTYKCFWKSKSQQKNNFIILFSIFVFLLSGIFFGIFFGIFAQVMKYPLEQVNNCQVIGQLHVNVYGVSEYAILYINYEKDGIMYLGYGCLDSQNKGTSGIVTIAPYQFYEFGDLYQCPNSSPDSSYFDIFSKSRNLYYNAYPNKRVQASKYCQEKWTFSQVKVASWMCLPINTPFQELTGISNNCYISYYGNQKNAIQNSLDRSNLKYVDDFVIVAFSDFLIPIDQYILFLIFSYCPFIVSSVILTMPFQRYYQNQINKSKKQLRLIYYVPYLERVQKDENFLQNQTFDIQQDNICQIAQIELQKCELKDLQQDQINQSQNRKNSDNLGIVEESNQAMLKQKEPIQHANEQNQQNQISIDSNII